MHVDNGVRVYSRPGRELTSAGRLLAGLADVVPSGTVLDGELVSDSGRAGTFYRLAGELAGPAAGGVSFVAFDVLAVAGVRVTDTAYAERRQVLAGLGVAGPSWCTMRSWTGVAPEEILAACAAEDV